VTWSKPPTEHPVSRMTRPDVLLSLVRAPALPPPHADFGSQFHTPSNRCLRFGPRVAATPARLAPVLPARLWTGQTCTGKLIPAFLSHPAYSSPVGGFFVETVSPIIRPCEARTARLRRRRHM